jgi:hypothetical protein
MHQAKRRAKLDEIIVYQFVDTVVAEKLAAMGTVAERRRRTAFKAFYRLMRGKGRALLARDDTAA